MGGREREREAEREAVGKVFIMADVFLLPQVPGFRCRGRLCVCTHFQVVIGGH